MAIAEVQKIQILAHRAAKMEILSSIQEEGLIHLESADFDELGLNSPTPDISQLEHSLHRLSHALTYLSKWEEKGFVKRMFSQKPQLDRQKREEVLSMDYLPLLDEIDKLEARKNELTSEIRFLEKELEFLFPLKTLELPLTSLEPTDSAEILLGTLPLSREEDFQKMAAEEPLCYEVINKEKRYSYLLVVYLKKEKVHLEQILKELNFSPLYLTESILSRAEGIDKVEDVIGKISKEIKEKKKRFEALEREGQSLFTNRENLMLVYDVLHNEREKILSSRLSGETERAFYLEGWVRSSDIGSLRSKLEPYSQVVELYFRPPLPEEDPPVILENPKASQPFEVVTKLYGLPLRGSFDPTLPLAPFFFLFVGLCVSEAGYGLLVALLSFLFIKFGKPKGGLLQFLKLLSLLGISTVILGTLVGGWFGFPVRSLMLLDPLQDPLSFLGLAIALGFIQVWFGTLLNMINGLKNKLYLQSIFVQGGWLLLLPSIVLYFIPQTKKPIWGILTLLGAAGIVFFASPSRNPFARFFGGLYSLYDISRYLADVLSYSRLLALGLATTVIAMVVNTLCRTALGIPWVGWLFAALIFVGGHLFNLGISFLGGFVHSMRLQFVEFFSKFFKSGGRPFKPFELESKYVDFI
ncbi:MAG: V-type ATP synthase subunit I [Candidatus Aminicenantes bacterium]|nr:MAG: V-type ATP synthase subunit I [Candidatus Aminicenantes bacterium]